MNALDTLLKKWGVYTHTPPELYILYVSIVTCPYMKMLPWKSQFRMNQCTLWGAIIHHIFFLNSVWAPYNETSCTQVSLTLVKFGACAGLQ